MSGRYLRKSLQPHTPNRMLRNYPVCRAICESPFVRHVYFTGAEEPYDKLKRALRAEIDEEAWSSIYSTISCPFDKPETVKIAIKVINHYGDEVLKVFEV